MTAVQLLTLLGVLVGLFATVGAPIIKLNTNIATLNETIKAIQKQQDKLESCNSDEHRRLWEKNAEQDGTLSEHEMRIHDLEGK